MARFFGGRKNQAENDFRRFEQEMYLKSSPRPTQPSDREPTEEYDDQYVQPNLGNRGNPPSLRQESYQQQPQPQQRPQPSFRSAPSLEDESGDFGRLRSSRQNERQSERQNKYGQGGYNQNHYKKPLRKDELKGLSFWQDDQEESSDDSEEWVERPSPFKFIVALIGLTVMVAILWFGYRWLSQPNAEGPVLIEAEPGPFKVKPENPGGAEIPYQDKLIYGRITPGTETQVERLLPPPEQPMAPPVVDPSQQQQPGYPQQPSQQQQPYPQQGHQPSGVPVPPQPVPGQANQGQVNQGQVNHGQQAYYPPQPQGGQPYPGQQMQQPVYAPQPPQPQAVAPIAPEAPAPIEVAPSKPAPAAKIIPGAGFYIQLGTLPTETAAKDELKRLRKKHRAELADYDDRTEVFEADDGKKIYRALIGPFQKRNAALSKCNRLGSTCRVIQLP